MESAHASVLPPDQAKCVANEPKAEVTPRTTPSQEDLETWRHCDCCCFDVDCTVTINDGLDLLAEFMNVKHEVEALTNQAMDGSMNMETSLDERLKVINCKPEDVRRFVKANPPESRLTPGIENLIKLLQRRGVAVYLISGGFREIIIPIANLLGISKDNVFANRMNWQWDDETGEPTRLAGFDMYQPTAYNQGKIKAIAAIREMNPYRNVVMIGDGITDLEAVESTQGADLFIGYGGVVERKAVAAAAPWFVYSHDTLAEALGRRKVAMIGSGSFASAMLHIVAANVIVHDEFSPQIKCWVHDAKSEYEGRSLLDIINQDKVNPKYLPGVDLGKNVTAFSDLTDVVKDADILIFASPHQYMHNITRKLMGKVKPDALAISLAKGMHVAKDGPQLISQMIRRNLGLDCSVLMGGNVAVDVGKHQLSEAVVAAQSEEIGQIFKKLFECSYFNVDTMRDVPGAEMCGTLKNIVALGSGMVDGMDFGTNTKSVIMREGLYEMRKLSKAMYSNVRTETFFNSCGMGDLITTCLGGRNRMVAEAWTRATLSDKPQTWDELEKELLSGQSLQGVKTSQEVQHVLKSRNWERDYPLFTTINRIINSLVPVQSLMNYKEVAKMPIAVREEEEDMFPSRRMPSLGLPK